MGKQATSVANIFAPYPADGLATLHGRFRKPLKSFPVHRFIPSAYYCVLAFVTAMRLLLVF